ncbi:MAG: response regulator transcription factor [Flavobacteriales bacterium]
MTIDVALVDDHHLMRTGLVGVVNAMPGYQVSLEASNGKEFIGLLQLDALPAIAIVDLNMPVMDGYATIAWLRANRPTILPLALTFDATDEAMVRAVRAGARGFVLKSAHPHVLKNALDSLMLTGYYYTEDAHEVMTRNPEMKTREERERDRVLERITPREMEFLLLVCDEAEYTYEQIAEHMGVHRRTVDNFRIGLFEKFNIKSKTGLVLFAMRWGLVK